MNKKTLIQIVMVIFFGLSGQIVWADLVGISYNDSTGQNEIHQIDPNTGTSILILSFSFDSGAYSAFCIDSQTNTAFAVSSARTLYQFDLNTGY